MTPSPITTWFEIPSVDFDRAIRFYENILKLELKRETMESINMAVFPHQEKQTAGAVVHSDDYQPSPHGICLYLYSNDFDAALERIEQHGGKVLMPKKSIGPNGFIALFMDSEGNRVGLHTDA